MMKYSSLFRFFTFAFIVCFSSNAISQVARVPVVEAGAAEVPQNQNQQPATVVVNPVSSSVNASNNDVVMTLYLQLESLQQEVQTLRGMVEEQNYKMGKMETEQRDRYLDIDGRLSGISTSTVKPTNTAPANVPAVQANNEVGSVGRVSMPGDPGYLLPAVIGADDLDKAQEPAPQSEQEFYRNALNALLEESKYEESITLFQEYINTYPDGRYLTNAYYWQGEGLILVERYNEAKDVFLQITQNFPQYPKAPSAMVKLGLVYNRMGDTELALQTWQNISIEYPENTSEIQAAEEFLRRFGGL